MKANSHSEDYLYIERKVAARAEERCKTPIMALHLAFRYNTDIVPHRIHRSPNKEALLLDKVWFVESDHDDRMGKLTWERPRMFAAGCGSRKRGDRGRCEAKRRGDVITVATVR
jgi:hypothetical protein